MRRILEGTAKAVVLLLDNNLLFVFGGQLPHVALAMGQ
ncbi:hypothetical protein FHR87_003902 [Azomonas macrocytogenes]|uniref:Uncharacterized protein n=1 Tax=Azomonas macrocytogenes TaxID=69962 RepID=A0A839T8M0_AZOMA|nr:hypothetical protein [Azomonas macrocytogenes]